LQIELTADAGGGMLAVTSDVVDVAFISGWKGWTIH
jgi:hypothetical protein